MVGLILPWNGPFGTFLIKVAPALAARCGCVVKSAEDTPLSALLLAETALEAGIPGVLNVLTGDASTGEALVHHKDVDKISFTGSTSVGKKIVNACSHDLKRITLELGGSHPVSFLMIVILKPQSCRSYGDFPIAVKFVLRVHAYMSKKVSMTSF